MNTKRATITRVILCVLILTNLISAWFLFRYKDERESLSNTINFECRVLRHEACAALIAEEYDTFAPIAYQYQEISRFYDEDTSYSVATEPFLDEAYFEDSLENRKSFPITSLRPSKTARFA